MDKLIAHSRYYSQVLMNLQDRSSAGIRVVREVDDEGVGLGSPSR